MPHLAHWDIRVDNLLRRPGGEIVFLDWGTTARGSRVGRPAARAARAGRRAVVRRRSTARPPRSPRRATTSVTAFLAGFGAHMAVRSVVAVDVNLPTLNDFRITESRRMLAAVARRTGR